MFWSGGFGSAVLEFFNSRHLTKVQVECFGLPDAFIEQGTRAELLELCNLTEQAVADAVRAFIKE